MKRDLNQKNLIETHGNDKRIINLIHIKSLIRYMLLIAKKNSNGIYNVSDYSINIKEIAKLIKIKYGTKNSKIKFKNLHKKNPKFYLSTNKLFSF